MTWYYIAGYLEDEFFDGTVDGVVVHGRALGDKEIQQHYEEERQMKFICDHSEKCSDKACPHRRSHDDCGHTCERVAAGARCVMDVKSLPEIGKTGTVAIMIKSRGERGK